MKIKVNEPPERVIYTTGQAGLSDLFRDAEKRGLKAIKQEDNFFSERETNTIYYDKKPVVCWFEDLNNFHYCYMTEWKVERELEKLIKEYGIELVQTVFDKVNDAYQNKCN